MRDWKQRQMKTGFYDMTCRKKLSQLVSLFWFFVVLLPACGLQLEDVSDSADGDDPAFLSVSVTITSAADQPAVRVAAVDFSVADCSRTASVRQSFEPRSGRSQVFNLSSADVGCRFSFMGFTIESGAGTVVYEPVADPSLSGDRTRLVQRYVPTSGQGRLLYVDVESTYTGSFSENHSIVVLLGFERTGRMAGIELQRVDLADEELPEGEAVGVGLRVESMVARRSRGGQGILALEVRMSCLELRELNTCFGRDLVAYEFQFIESDEVPSAAVLEGAWDQPRLVTRIKNENLFGNGVYALVSTPKPLPNSNTPPTTLWLLVRSEGRVSAFQVTTAGMAVFD